MTGPPPRLIEGLLAGPSLLSGFEWHEEIDSTNRRCLALAGEGHAEGCVVAADLQTAGRGRQGRTWVAPAGTSLMLSILLRPRVPAETAQLLPLLVGLALAEVVEAHVPGSAVALKWPNDLLVAGRKCAGILVESDTAGAAVAGIGLNVDWRGVERPAELAAATSLAEVTDRPVDRWRLLAGLIGVLGNRYAAWQSAPTAFLTHYRARCATLGQRVRVRLGSGEEIVGDARDVAATGALAVQVRPGEVVAVTAGDVEHLRLSRPPARG